MRREPRAEVALRRTNATATSTRGFTVNTGATSGIDDERGDAAFTGTYTAPHP
jgi:hypothetical protein